MTSRRREPTVGGIESLYGVPRSDNLINCSTCGAAVRPAYIRRHAEWHEEINRIVGTFVAERLRELEEELGA